MIIELNIQNINDITPRYLNKEYNKYIPNKLKAIRFKITNHVVHGNLYM
jgi:uncharacterized protein YebE (UPF0316 family)